MSDTKRVGDRRVTDARGVTFIPSTKRADGSWRREIKVRPGYVPQDEVEAYKAPRMKTKARGPIGLAPVGLAPVKKAAAEPKKGKNKKKNKKKREGEGGASGGGGGGAKPKPESAEARRKREEEERLAKRLEEAARIVDEEENN